MFKRMDTQCSESSCAGLSYDGNDAILPSLTQCCSSLVFSHFTHKFLYTHNTHMPIHTQSPTHTCLYVQAELENLGHIPGVNPAFLAPSSPPSLTPSLPHTSALTTHLTLTVQDVEGEGEGEAGKAEDGEQQNIDGKPADGILPLVPPSSLFNPPERHPLHIFVSSSYNALCTIHLSLVSSHFYSFPILFSI